LHAIVLETALKLITKMKVGDVEIKNAKRTQRVVGRGNSMVLERKRYIAVCIIVFIDATEVLMVTV